MSIVPTPDGITVRIEQTGHIVKLIATRGKEEVFERISLHDWKRMQHQEESVLLRPYMLALQKKMIRCGMLSLKTKVKEQSPPIERIDESDGC